MKEMELNIPLGLKSGDHVECRIDDKIIEGEVYIGPKDVAVRLVNTDIGLKASLHMMLMQPALYTPDTSSPIANERGRSRIKDLMTGRSRDYLTVKANKEEILRRIHLNRQVLSGHEEEFNSIFGDILSECTHSDNLQEVILSLC